MTAQSDIYTRADIDRLVTYFYTQAIPDKEIGYFFTEVKPLDLASHLPTLVDFWENLLFGNPVYQGSPMRVHVMLDQLSPLQPQHFARWLTLWHTAVDTLFIGPKANLAKEKANMVGRSLQMRLQDMRSSLH